MLDKNMRLSRDISIKSPTRHEEYNAGIFSMPDPAFPTAFQDATGSAMEEDAKKGAFMHTASIT
jgi:hypothetical protein